LEVSLTDDGRRGAYLGRSALFTRKVTMRRVVPGALLAPILVLACAQSPGPASLTPAPADILALQGEWVGTFQADVQHGRTGAILFNLDTTEDVAQGCALMRVAGRETAEALPLEGDLWSHIPPERRLLVTFVRGEDGEVLGNFAVFPDPVCGCDSTLRLTGRIRGNVLEGTYVMEHVGGAERTLGKWRVVRRAAT
jgi:hypothetical protein